MNDFEVLSQLATENKDIAVSTTVVEATTCKKGGKITMGVEAKNIQQALNDSHYFMLVIVNKEQFNSIKWPQNDK